MDETPARRFQRQRHAGSGDRLRLDSAVLRIFAVQQQVEKRARRDREPFRRTPIATPLAPQQAGSQDVEAVEANEYEPKIRDVRFSLDEFNADINACNAKLEGALK